MSKTRHISIRVSDEEHEEIRAAAEEADRSMSEHLRKSALSSSGHRVPPINETVWEELAPAVANLNQLAHRANRFRRHLEKAGELKHDTRRALVSLMKSTRETVRSLRDELQTLRRDLYGAAPLEQAAATLTDWRRVAHLGRVDAEPERLDGLIDELRELADVLEKEGGR